MQCGACVVIVERHGKVRRGYSTGLASSWVGVPEVSCRKMLATAWRHLAYRVWALEVDVRRFFSVNRCFAALCMDVAPVHWSAIWRGARDGSPMFSLTSYTFCCI